jgi:hypothetical protein
VLHEPFCCRVRLAHATLGMDGDSGVGISCGLSAGDHMLCVCAYYLGLQVIFPPEVEPWHAQYSSHALEPLQEERCTTALELTEKTCEHLSIRSRLWRRQRMCPSHLLQSFS